MLDVELEGVEDLLGRLRGLPRTIQAAIQAKAQSVADALQADVVQDKLSGQILQSRTGALRNAIAAEVSLDGSKVQIRLYARGDVRYAAIQEYGGHTPAHDIAARKGRVLAFMAGGRKVFASTVHHPGSTIPAMPFMAPALAEMTPKIIAALKDAVTSGAGV